MGVRCVHIIYQRIGFFLNRDYILWKNIFQLFINLSVQQDPRCLKITEKVSFNIASEASYVYILSGQKLIKNCPFWRVFEKPEACGQSVLPDRSILIGPKLAENAKIQKIQMRHFE